MTQSHGERCRCDLQQTRGQRAPVRRQARRARNRSRPRSTKRKRRTSATNATSPNRRPKHRSRSRRKARAGTPGLQNAPARIRSPRTNPVTPRDRTRRRNVRREATRQTAKLRLRRVVRSHQTAYIINTCRHLKTIHYLAV